MDYPEADHINHDNPYKDDHIRHGSGPADPTFQPACAAL